MLCSVQQDHLPSVRSDLATCPSGPSELSLCSSDAPPSWLPGPPGRPSAATAGGCPRCRCPGRHPCAPTGSGGPASRPHPPCSRGPAAWRRRAYWKRGKATTAEGRTSGRSPSPEAEARRGRPGRGRRARRRRCLGDAWGPCQEEVRGSERGTFGWNRIVHWSWWWRLGTRARTGQSWKRRWLCSCAARQRRSPGSWRDNMKEHKCTNSWRTRRWDCNSKQKGCMKCTSVIHLELLANCLGRSNMSSNKRHPRTTTYSFKVRQITDKCFRLTCMLSDRQTDKQTEATVGEPEQWTVNSVTASNPRAPLKTLRHCTFHWLLRPCFPAEWKRWGCNMFKKKDCVGKYPTWISLFLQL